MPGFMRQTPNVGAQPRDLEPESYGQRRFRPIKALARTDVQ